MIKEELYHKSVQILYDAYFNGTLEHSNCFACAVGNLVAANMGKKFLIDHSVKEQRYYWEGYCPYSSHVGEQPEWFPLEWASANNEILSTGYSKNELMNIEKAFEAAGGVGCGNKENKMFNGLVAVLEVLKDIHQVTDEDLIQGNNKRFKDHYNRKVSQVEG